MNIFSIFLRMTLLCMARPGATTTQQPNTNKTMKNVKVNLKKASKAGFSLVEMLVVIAIIGIIAAIAIPNIGNINDASKQSAAQRNAQQLASTWNAAVVAGYVPTETSAAEALASMETGVTIPDGPFAGKNFTVGDIDDDTEANVLSYLNFADGNLTYSKTPTP